VESLLEQLDRDGIVRLPALVTETQLRQMREAFRARLHRVRWNNIDGYEKTEPYRHMVEDVLTIDQGFVDVGLHPLVKQIIGAYVGDSFQLAEAKGWRSLPTRRDFHGWHADTWYDQTVVSGIPREVKLAFYLSDVTTGAFNYVLGTHRRNAPRVYDRLEVERIDRQRIVEVPGPAGSAFLFDTTGIHRQGVPILEPREAIFLNYHDSATPLHREASDYNRYHPLLLNAAFLGGLTAEDHRILGFGDVRRFRPAFERRSNYERFHLATQRALDGLVHASLLLGRLTARLRRLTRG
jgi:hypothetical protein